MCVVGQAVDQVKAEGLQVQLIVSNEYGHAGAPIGAGHSHPIDAGMLDARERADRLSHLGGGDIFTLPAEGVAGTVDEIEITLLVLSHQVAGTKPGVSRLEDIAEYFAGGGFLVGVALESTADVRWVVEKTANCFSGLVASTANAESLRIAERLTSLGIELHQRCRKSMREI